MLAPKELEILREVVPQATQIGVLWDATPGVSLRDALKGIRRPLAAYNVVAAQASKI